MISVIITHHAKPLSTHHLLLVLDSLERQTLDHDEYEVLVIYVGNDIEHRKILDLLQWQETYGMNLHFLHLDAPNTKRKMKTIAANFGARAASGDLLLFVDQDTWMTREYLERTVAAQQEWPEGNLLATAPLHLFTRPTTLVEYEALRDITPEGLAALESGEKPCPYVVVDSTPRMQYRQPTGDYFMSALPCFHTGRFWAIGGYDETYSHYPRSPEDYDICQAFVRGPAPKFQVLEGIASFHLYHLQPVPDSDEDAQEGWDYYREKWGIPS